ncbi:MAG TPA: hypothetical protein VGL61_22040 [Kofleriaceae bacterium]
MRGLASLVIVAVMGVVVASCGPFAYVDQVTLHADDAVEQARDAGAPQYSPYYWTRATQYLVMAREVAAHADFQGANKFGRLAEEAAIKAKDEALAKRSQPMPAAPVAPVDKPATTLPAEPIAPAKDPNATAPAKDGP